jgi:hypothetical protein
MNNIKQWLLKNLIPLNIIGVTIGLFILVLVLKFQLNLNILKYLLPSIVFYNLFVGRIFYEFEKIRIDLIYELSFKDKSHLFKNKFDYTNNFWKLDNILSSQIYLFLCIHVFIPYISLKNGITFLQLKVFLYNCISLITIITISFLLNYIDIKC